MRGEPPERPVVPEGLEREVAIASLHRYWVWSDTLRHLFLAQLAGEPEPALDDLRGVGLIIAANLATTGQILFGSYWLASLYVIVEGWGDLGLSDHDVENCLEDEERVRLLRRYRNVVFHFQRNAADPRVFEFLEQPVAEWTAELHQALGRAIHAELDRIGEEDDA